MLKQLKHKNIIKLYNAFMLKSDICLIMEYADGGELVDYVEEKKGITEPEARSIIKQVVNAIDLCHQ